MYRKVLVSLKDPTGQPLKNQVIQFSLKTGIFSSVTPDFYPNEVKSVSTNLLGEVDLNLWANEDSESPAVYNFKLPGYSFDAILPSGTEDIKLSTIKALAIPPSNPVYSSLFYSILSEIALNGGGGGGSVDLTNYYTKPQVDNLLVGIVSGGTVDLTNYYTKTETNALIPTIPTSLTAHYLKTETYSQSQVNALIPSSLSSHYLKTETYSQSQVNALIPSLVNYYTKTQVDNLIPTSLTAHYLKSETYSQTQINNSFLNYYTQTQIDALLAGLGGGGGGSVDLSDYYTKTQVDALIPTSLSTHYLKSETYTKTETNALVTPGSLNSIVYDSQNRVQSYSINAVPYTVSYTATTQVIVGGGYTRTITYDLGGNLVSNVIT
jgi:hypothetical protein